MRKTRINLIHRKSRRPVIAVGAALIASSSLWLFADYTPSASSSRPESARAVVLKAAPAPAPVIHPASAAVTPASPGELEQIQNAIHGRFAHSKTFQGLTTKLEHDSLDITFRTDRVFHVGAAEVQSKSQLGVLELVGLIEEQAKDFDIQVEGHTDDSPIVKHRKQYSTNWELSGARAAAIVRLFEGAGVEKARLEAIGFGESRPVMSALNPAQNRRVVIRLIKKKKEEKRELNG